MMIFSAKGGAALHEHFGGDEYYNAEIIECGGSVHVFFAILKPHGGIERFFTFQDPIMYDKILSAYNSNETIGLVL